MKTTLLPLFDNLDHIHLNLEQAVLPDPRYFHDFFHTLNFLKSYNGSLGTFNSYRRETERLLQWCWHIQEKTLPELKREDLEQYIRFCQNPPETWISLKKVHRYIESEGKRIPNSEWRPFVVHVSKTDIKKGKKPSIDAFNLSHGATQEIFAILSTFFNFLISEEYVPSNPIALIRQKSKFIQKSQQNAPIRRLSNLQWQTVLNTAELLAEQDPKMHERTRFILTLLYGMYLRISELAASDRWIPTMNDFTKDSEGNWWFTTVGKGNKKRQIAVSDTMLKSLIRWRLFLGLSPLPNVSDNTPLIPRIRGTGPMSDTAPLRRLVQLCFDKAAEILHQQNQIEEAENLHAATVHWLRHTGISEDVKIRPREHVRDDAGHSSSSTTDRYIDVELQERHRTARNKTLGSVKQ